MIGVGMEDYFSSYNNRKLKVCHYINLGILIILHLVSQKYNYSIEFYILYSQLKAYEFL